MQCGRPVKDRLVLLLAFRAQHAPGRGVARAAAAHAPGGAEDAENDRAVLDQAGAGAGGTGSPEAADVGGHTFLFCLR
mgnify:CR=1 FL=1